MPKAYSYLRFSSPEQAKGDSFRRQIELTQAYALKHGLELDEHLTFHDKGVSAWKNKHAETGRLGAFLIAVENGLVPKGSYLLVESLDRISRSAARKALKVLEDIVDGGVTLVTLNDGKIYTSDILNNDVTALIVAILTFIRANEESETKSKRLKSSWSAKRKSADSKIMTRRCPAWLTYDESKKNWEQIPERVEVVRRIFRETREGKGENTIASGLNQDKVTTWGDNGRQPAFMWHKSYVQKILHSPNVIGDLVSYAMDRTGSKVTRKIVSTAPNYYPAIIDLPLWESVGQIKATRTPLRGRHAGKAIQNIVGGLIRCSACGGAMTRVNKGQRDTDPKLICQKARSGMNCEIIPVSLDAVEQAFRKFFFDKFVMPMGDNNVQSANDFIVKARERITKIDDLIHAYTESESRKDSKSGAEWFTKLLDQRDELIGKIEINEGLVKMMSGKSYELAFNEAKLAFEQDEIDRGKINIILRRMFTKVTYETDFGWLSAQTPMGWGHVIPIEHKDISDIARQRAKSSPRLSNGRFGKKVGSSHTPADE